MKVFISVPMRDKTEEEIKKEIAIVTNIAKAYFPEENALGTLEFVDNLKNHSNDSDAFGVLMVTPPKDDNKKPLYSLGEALQKLSNCDAIMSPYDARYTNRECTLEYAAAKQYDIDVYEYDDKILTDGEEKKVKYE